MRAPSVWIFAPGVTTSVAKSIMSSPPGLSATSRRTRPRRPRAVRSTAMVIGVLSLNPPGFPALLPPRKLWSSSTMTLGSAPSSSRSGRTIALRRLVQPGPRGLIGPESQGVLEALGRDSVLLRRHEPYRGEPRRERGVGTVEDRPGRDRGLQGALDAHSKPSPNVPTLATATARARETSRPAEPGEILPTSLVIRKPGPKLLVRPRVVHPAYWAGARRHFPSLLHSSRDAGQLTEISDLCVTGAFAGRVYLNIQTVPVVPATTLSLYANNPRRLGDQLGLIRMDRQSSNVVIAAPRDPDLVTSPALSDSDLPLAPLPQVLADLLTLPGRESLLADQLMDQLAESDPMWGAP